MAIVLGPLYLLLSLLFVLRKLKIITSKITFVALFDAVFERPLALTEFSIQYLLW